MLILQKKILQQHKGYQKSLLIKAPATGKIIKLNANVGDRVTTQTMLAIIADPTKKIITAYLENSYKNKIPKNIPVQIFLGEKSSFSGNIISSFVSWDINKPSTIKVAFSGSSSSLPFGTDVVIKIKLPEKKQTLCIPKKAVVYRRNIHSRLYPVVYQIIPDSNNEYILNQIPVKIGMSDENFCEVEGALKEDESVVIRCNLGMNSLCDKTIASMFPTNSKK